MKIKVDQSGLRKRLTLMEKRMFIAARAGVLAASDAVVDYFERDSPRDTNRYVRAWLEAGSKAGGKARLLPEVKRGRYAKHQIQMLEDQLIRIRKSIEWRSRRFDAWSRDRNGRPRKLSRWMQAERRRIYSLMNLYERAKQEFSNADNDGELFIVIYKGRGRRLNTVRTKVYGGDGRVYRVGRTSARVTLKNKEAHASIVESRLGVKSKAYLAVNERAVMQAEFERVLREG